MSPVVLQLPTAAVAYSKRTATVCPWPLRRQMTDNLHDSEGYTSMRCFLKD